MEDKIEDINLILKEYEEKKNIDLISINKNLNYLKNDFLSLNENYMREIDDIKNNINKQKILKNKEIVNFNQHILEEHVNLLNLLMIFWKKNIDKIKSMNEYLNSDVYYFSF